MNFNRRFSEIFFPEKIKKLMKTYIGDIQQFQNVRTIAYLNSINIKGKSYNYRLHNTQYANQFSSKDLLLKAFFRSFSDNIFVCKILV